jgi:hypothetical protein
MSKFQQLETTQRIEKCSLNTKDSACHCAKALNFNLLVINMYDAMSKGPCGSFKNCLHGDKMLGTHLCISSWMIMTYHQLQQNKIQKLLVSLATIDNDHKENFAQMEIMLSFSWNLLARNKPQLLTINKYYLWNEISDEHVRLDAYHSRTKPQQGSPPTSLQPKMSQSIAPS